jgi:hypothetical protein
MHQPLHRAALTPIRTPADVRAVAALEDRVGILSAFFAPGPGSRDLRLLRDKLMVLRERALPWRARDRRALALASDRVLRRVRQAPPAATTGAVAIYWLVDAGESVELALPDPVASTATLAARAQLGPLCEAVAACRRAGVLRVDGDLAALYELSAAVLAPPRLLGRAEAAAGDVLSHAVRRGWDLLLVAGRGPAADALLDDGRCAPGLPAIVDARAALAEAGAAWPAAARARVAQARRRRGLDRLDALARQARHGDGAVCGRAATAEALASGLVEELVVAVPAAEALLHAAATRAGTTITVVDAATDPHRPPVAARLRAPHARLREVA